MNTSLIKIANRLTESFTGNTTSDGEAYGTPYAFSDEVEDPDDSVYSETPPKSDIWHEHLDRFYSKVQHLTELNYKEYKTDDSKTERQKINDNIMEINRKLREVEQMINHANRLKVESGADNTVYWKGTLGRFLKIKERLNRLSTKIVEMSGG